LPASVDDRDTAAAWIRQSYGRAGKRSPGANWLAYTSPVSDRRQSRAHARTVGGSGYASRVRGSERGHLLLIRGAAQTDAAARATRRRRLRAAIKLR